MKTISPWRHFLSVRAHGKMQSGACSFSHRWQQHLTPERSSFNPREEEQASKGKLRTAGSQRNARCLAIEILELQWTTQPQANLPSNGLWIIWQTREIESWLFMSIKTKRRRADRVNSGNSPDHVINCFIFSFSPLSLFSVTKSGWCWAWICV